MGLSICDGEGIYLPPSHCDDCSALEQRVEELENKLDGVRRVTIAKTDDDNTQSGFFLGDMNNG